MPNPLANNAPLSLVAAALALGLCCAACSGGPPPDLRVDYTAVAIVPAGLVPSLDLPPAPADVAKLVEVSDGELAVVLDELSLTTADFKIGELKGSRFLIDQVHLHEDGERVLTAKIHRARSAGELKVERHVTLAQPMLLGRFTGELSPHELIWSEQRDRRARMPEVEIAIVATARPVS
jgi:hypothetical protein